MNILKFDEYTLEDLTKKIEELQKKKESMEEEDKKLQSVIHFSRKENIGCLTLNPVNIISQRLLPTGHLEIILNEQGCDQLEDLFPAKIDFGRLLKDKHDREPMTMGGPPMPRWDMQTVFENRGAQVNGQDVNLTDLIKDIGKIFAEK